MSDIGSAGRGMETYGIGGVCKEAKFRFLIVSVDCMKACNCGVCGVYTGQRMWISIGHHGK